MAKEYDPKEIEGKWQKEWEKSGLYKTPDSVTGKDNFYFLTEFAYPSGNLHIGHWYAFSVPDILARYLRMNGKNVLYPAGFDAFGLPAENAAIKNKRNPAEWTTANIDYMRKQERSMGTSFDWSREVVTCDPKYYKWTQWQFTEFLKKGLAYQAEREVNWCPKDKTVLANEQVVNGLCERCDSAVEKRNMVQWNLKITDYADRLINDLDGLDWPEPIKAAQKNWIGRSEGVEIDFTLLLKNQNAKFILLHGHRGRADRNFIPWLKRELENKGFKVDAPQLPNTDTPTEEEQVKYVLDNCVFDKDTVVIGHSLGAVVALKALMKAGKDVSGLVLVAPAMSPEFEKQPKLFHKTFSWNLNYSLIRKLTGEKITILSDLREGKRINYLKYLTKELNARLIEVKSKEEHFTATEEPEILKSVTPIVTVFTTRPDTIFGATYLVLSPEHPWVTLATDDNHKGVIENATEVKNYIKEIKKKTDMERTSQGREKTGVELKGVRAINPATKEEIPIWIADYVLPHYGTGAIMAVPADDERDKEFAEKFGLPIVENYSNAGLEDYGRKVTKYKLRDWVVSRQRYWGVPIPVIHCKKCGAQPVPEMDLPVLLPEIEDYLPRDDGKSPLAKVHDWVLVKCPQCDEQAERETDTLDTFVDSSWYYLRYTDPQNDQEFAAKERIKKWMPVDLYSGGSEHTTMHLLYSRFWHKVLFDLGLVGESEPYRQRMNRGLILGPDGQKMSKSRGNIIDPDKEVDRLGADTVRMYMAFIGPYNVAGSYPWNLDAAVGIRRFLERIWQVGFKDKNDDVKHQEVLMNQTIKKVSEDVKAMKFNTAISSLMVWLNTREKGEEGFSQNEFATLLLLLAPFAPHITEELWNMLGHNDSIHIQPWPTYDPDKLETGDFTLAIQVDGKVRASLVVSRSQSEEEIKTAALSLPEIKKWLKGNEPKKVILVPKRIISIVTTA